MWPRRRQDGELRKGVGGTPWHIIRTSIMVPTTSCASTPGSPATLSNESFVMQMRRVTSSAIWIAAGLHGDPDGQMVSFMLVDALHTLLVPWARVSHTAASAASRRSRRDGEAMGRGAAYSNTRPSRPATSTLF